MRGAGPFGQPEQGGQRQGEVSPRGQRRENRSCRGAAGPAAGSPGCRRRRGAAVTAVAGDSHWCCATIAGVALRRRLVETSPRPGVAGAAITVRHRAAAIGGAGAAPWCRSPAVVAGAAGTVIGALVLRCRHRRRRWPARLARRGRGRCGSRRVMPLRRSRNASTRSWSIRAPGRSFAALYAAARSLIASFAASAASVGRPNAASAHAPPLSRQNRTRASSRSACWRRLAAPSGSTVHDHLRGEPAELRRGLPVQLVQDQLLRLRGVLIVQHFQLIGDDPGLQRREGAIGEGGADAGQAGLQVPRERGQVVGGPQRDRQRGADLMRGALLPLVGQVAVHRRAAAQARPGPAAQQLADHAELAGLRPRPDRVPPAQQADQLLVGRARAPPLRTGQLRDRRRQPRAGRAGVAGTVLGEPGQPGIAARSRPRRRRATRSRGPAPRLARARKSAAASWTVPFECDFQNPIKSNSIAIRSYWQPKLTYLTDTVLFLRKNPRAARRFAGLTG